MQNHPPQRPADSTLAQYLPVPGMLIGSLVLLSAWFVPGGISGWLVGQEVAWADIAAIFVDQPHRGRERAYLGTGLIGMAVIIVQLARLIFFTVCNVLIALLWIVPSVIAMRSLRPKPRTPRGPARRVDPQQKATSSIHSLLESRTNGDLV